MYPLFHYSLVLISAPLTTHAFDVASTVLPSLWAKLGFAVAIQLVSRPQKLKNKYCALPLVCSHQKK